MKSFLYPSRPLQQTGPPNELRQGQGRDKESESGRIDLTYDKYFTRIPNMDRCIVGQIEDAIFGGKQDECGFNSELTYSSDAQESVETAEVPVSWTVVSLGGRDKVFSCTVMGYGM